MSEDREEPRNPAPHNWFRRNRQGRAVEAQQSFDSSEVLRLESRLKAEIEGDVRFDNGTKALYATDASNYRQVPVGVVLPKSEEDVVKAIRLCAEADIPVLPRGGGTSLAGETCNVAVVIDFSRYMDCVLWIDPERKLAKVQPGCILDTLRDAAEEYDLTFGPDPATHDRNTLGGMIGNNSCGVHSVMAGRTADNVRELEIVTYDGERMRVGATDMEERRRIAAEGGRKAEIYAAMERLIDENADLILARYPRIPRRVSGYENLDQLLPDHGFQVGRALVGTEGTCVTVLSAVVELVESPRERVLAIAGFEDIFAAADVVPDALQSGPIGLEAIDELLIDFIRRKHLHPERARLLPEGKGWLIAEFGGATREEAVDNARRLTRAMEDKGCHVALLDDKADQVKIWELREAALAATARVPGMEDAWPGWEDSAVPIDSLGTYLRELVALFQKHDYTASVYGHFGDGLVHCRIPFRLGNEAGIDDWQSFLDEAADLVVRHGGSLSGEHGDGQARGALLEKMYGPELLAVFARFKEIWGPRGRMNPGKVVAPFPIDSNLRMGPSYNPPFVAQSFAFKADGGSFTRAVQRCVGVGACRRITSDKSVMCPSYMATREEKYSTRGRARLLFEMLHGGPLKDGWQSEEVEEALDMCLACKACVSDCPVNVDMATYKAEFRSHYYSRRRRPRHAYSMGLIHQWARLARLSPRLVNGGASAPFVSGMVKRIAGIASQRDIPRFAAQSFVQHYRQSSKATTPQRAGRDIVLWPDTFNNHFRPQTAQAAARVLARLGYNVIVPGEPVCCGRPLYDWGWLGKARALWKSNIEVLAPFIEAGTPIVGLEPACVSAFRNELPDLVPDDPMARRLSAQCRLLSEFLRDENAPLSASRSESAIVQLHCHHHAVLDVEAERNVLAGLGVEAEILPSGCCGMAGSFGFEQAKYDVSMACAERVLLPRVRSAPPNQYVVANGFSCREQIEQATGRKTWHLADLADHLLTSAD